MKQIKKFKIMTKDQQKNEKHCVQGSMVYIAQILIMLRGDIKTDVAWEDLSPEEQRYQYTIQRIYKDAYSAMELLDKSEFNISFWTSGSLEEDFKLENMDDFYAS